MEQTPSSVKTNSKKSNKALKIIPWVGLGLFVIAVALVGYLYATGRVAYNANGVIATVCGDTIVNKYNAALEIKMRSASSTDPGIDVAGLKALDTEIRAKPDTLQDPTCQTILFWSAIYNQDTAKAQTALNAIKTLHDQHKYVDSNLVNNAPASILEDSLKLMTDSPKG